MQNTVCVMSAMKAYVVGMCALFIRNVPRIPRQSIEIDKQASTFWMSTPTGGFLIPVCSNRIV